MSWFAPPPETHATVYTQLPDHFREQGVMTRWASANKGAPIDSFLEGPTFSADGTLWCVDIPFGRIFRIGPDKSWTLAVQYDGEPNGLAIAPDGRIFIADYKHGILALDPRGRAVEPVLDHVRGERFKGCNDLCFSADGDLYFTDQGATGLHDPTGRVYRLTTDGRLDCLLSNGPSPNGAALSPDGTALFVAMTRSGEVWRVPLRADGGTRKVQVFARLPAGVSGPDGMAVDVDGNLVVCHAGLGRVFQVDRLGIPRGIVRSPEGLTTTNCAYGGPDRQSLFITESETGSILLAHMDRPGVPLI